METNEHPAGQSAGERTIRRARPWKVHAVVVVLLLAVLVGAAWGADISRRLTEVNAAINPANVERLTTLYTLQEPDTLVVGVAFSPDGKTLASGTLGNYISLWEVSDGSLLRRVGYPDRKENASPVAIMGSVAFSPNEQTLACGTSFGTILQWRVSDLSQLPLLQGHGHVNGVVYSPDGQTLAAAAGREVQLWRVSDGSLLYSVEGSVPGTAMSNVVFSPNGQILAAGAGDGRVLLWQMPDGPALHTLHGEINAAFSPDGQVLATGSNSGNMIHLWRTSDWSLLRSLQGHSDYISTLAFSPDGQILASGSYDNTVRLWIVSDWSPLRTLQGHSAPILGIAFSPDGRVLASGSMDGTLRLWGLR